MDAVRWVDLAGPPLLFLMMAVVGLELTADDFRRVAREPRVILLGTLAQWTLLPGVTAALLLALDLPPHLAAGLVLLAAAPGGGVSNVFTYLAGAHTALSVTLTALASLGAAVVLPLLTAGGFALFVGPEEPGGVPVVAMMGQLLLLVLLPIGAGMELRRRRPGLAARWAGPGRRLVLLLLVLLLLVGFGSDRSGLAGDVPRALLPALAWTLLAFATGWATAAALGTDAGARFTLAIEFSVKNVGLAAIVALSGFHRPEFAVFAAAYLVTGYPLAVVAALAWRRTSGFRSASRGRAGS